MNLNIYAALVQEHKPRASVLVARKIDKQAPILRNAEYFAGVRIFHLSAGRESFDINKFAGRKRTFHHMRFARDRNAIRIIALRHFCGRRRSCRRRGRP